MKFSDLKILTIDDSAMMRKLITEMMINFGVNRDRIFQAEDGMAGLESMECNDIDVILCDLGMEPMDGFEFIRMLRNHERDELRTLPVIVLTVHDEDNYVTKATALPIDGYLLKPIAADTLKQRITQVLLQKPAAAGV